ncbi:related to lysophospholipase [Lecanosticta acicola]|uniref:Lysophospholipase n=1 Tax=Lecanosticta acicola TaxID=111012 RepID=A0AAI8Z4L9_9PEZI|nr:related to lysophospholipase [Lecanosticta acicola]
MVDLTCHAHSANGPTANPVPQELVEALLRRASPANAPHGYTPQTVDCPQSAPTIRSANRLSPNETAWLEVRRNATVQPMHDWLGRLNISGFDTSAYINNHKSNASALPNIAIAASGGGYRAMLNGAGILQAFDSRTPNSTNKGQLGGLLQASTYLAGLSGGSWLVGSLYSNNFTSVQASLLNSSEGSVWELGNSIFEGPHTGGIQLLDSVGYYSALLDQVNGKEDAGFNTTITDYWGRALSYQLINATDGGPSYTWSSIAEQDWFTRGTAPLPLIVADSRAPGEAVVSTNSTIFTFSPWELGSDDPTLYAFAPLKYVGTNFTGGRPQSDQCVVGFDSASYVMGTSSSLFNAILTTVNQTQTDGAFSSALQHALTSILAAIGQDEEDIADWVNPFYGYNNDTNRNSVDETLTLVDGGEDGQNIPLHPLIQPERHVDVIFAIDSSADTNTTWPTNTSAQNWPDGISMVSTYERSLSDIGNGTAFPAVPDINTFLNLGLNNRPTFFGCDAGNISGPAPLVIYLPNAPYNYYGNQSTYKLSYNDTERDAIVLNAYNGATQGNGTLDAEWPACVGCAVLSRSLNRTGTEVPQICNRCFSKYCWDGTVNSTAPASYRPPFKLAGDVVKVTTSGAAGRSSGSAVTLAIVSALGAAACAML